MSRPRLLDLFCGAGGAAMGYSRAGFGVVGVDINPQPHYPFEFVQMDVFELPYSLLAGDYDAIHASPPCQDHSMARNSGGLHGTGWMLGRTLELLAKEKVPWVVENVEGAVMPSAMILCGASFG